MKQQEIPTQRDYRKQPRRYDEPRDRNHTGAISFEGEVSLTKQSEAEACDINNIMKKYTETGIPPAADGRVPQYGDFSTMETFQEALEIVSHAKSQFYSMDAETRAEFQNDPAKFLQFVETAHQKEGGVEKLIKLGIAVERPETSESVLKDIRENTKPKPAKKAGKNEQGDD